MEQPSVVLFEAAIQNISAVIETHNTTTDEFEAKQAAALEALERAYVAAAFLEHKELARIAGTCETSVAEINAGVIEVTRKIAVLEADIVENVRPADEMNAELRSYLGHGELTFQVQGGGYRIVRRDQPALHLSEGEKSAITFLHFLKSLRDKDFDLTNGVVVIDDPVSSLDANSLFSAFGYMKARVEGVGQLILLTHNFQFFRQVRNWFHHLKNQGKKDPALRPARFYMMATTQNGGGRNANIEYIDPMLEQHESEYHYLFKKLVEESERPGPAGQLEEYYSMPNLGRRFIEGFFAFRYPDLESQLQHQFDQVNFDAGKKVRILRFLHTYSHADNVAELGHDPSVLSETKAIFTDLLDLVKTCDGDHYDRMKKAIQPTV